MIMHFLKLGRFDKAIEYSNRRLALEHDAPETHVDRGDEIGQLDGE
jgi:hypothetical protein